jgi:hypothetical protein
VFYVPVQGTRHITGEGSFNRGSVGPRINGAFEVTERAIDIRPLDSFDLSPDVVKIDVQGLELAVLRGMTKALEGKPLLLIEASPRTDDEIISFLRGYGYERHRAVDGRLVPADQGTPLNWFYRCPGTFEQLLA